MVASVQDFLIQYYNVSPDVAEQLTSKLTCTGPPNDDQPNYKAEISTVDSHESPEGGIDITVMGSLIESKRAWKRNFVHVFSLAPSEKGYIVMNNISNHEDEEPLPSLLKTELSKDSYKLVEEVIVPHITVPIVEQPAPALAEVQVASEGVSKKSYASVVQAPAMKTDSHPPTPPTRIASLKQAPATVPAAPVPSAVNEDRPATKTSVYVKNLPHDVSESQLNAEFKKFGQIKDGGIKIRTSYQHGDCYAFIDFTDEQSVQHEIKEANLQIGGRTIQVEEKKSIAGVRASGRNGGGRSHVRGGYNREGRGGYANGGGRGGGIGSYGREDGAVHNRGHRERYPTNNNNDVGGNDTVDDDGFEVPRRRKNKGRAATEQCNNNKI